MQLDEKLVQIMYGKDVGNSIGIIVQIAVVWKVGSNDGEDVYNSVGIILQKDDNYAGSNNDEYYKVYNLQML